jgi:hypothetical protein
MNIFDIQIEANKAVEDRAFEIYRVAQEVDNEFFEEEILPYMTEVNGITCNLNYWVEEDIHNWWCNQDECWKPKYTKRVNLYVSENPDPYDDYGVTSWSCEIPFDLAVSGTNEELKEFFIKKFEDENKRRKFIEDRELYMKLFNMDKELVMKIISKEGIDTTSYVEKEKLLYECGVLKQDDLN